MITDCVVCLIDELSCNHVIAMSYYIFAIENVINTGNVTWVDLCIVGIRK